MKKNLVFDTLVYNWEIKEISIHVNAYYVHKMFFYIVLQISERRYPKITTRLLKILEAIWSDIPAPLSAKI